MLRELITILSSSNPLSSMGEKFTQMLQLTRDMAARAGKMFFDRASAPDERTGIYEDDGAVNDLERSIRKEVVSHLSVAGNSPDLPYCLLLMSLVKDVERLGDYAKNLSELGDIHAEPIPDDDITKELREIRRGVEDAFSVTAEIFSTSDRERAAELIRKGRHIAQRADSLLHRIAAADYDAGTTTVLVLAVRYYKRIGGHVLNVLSSVVMPLHMIDYYDEDEIHG